MGSLHRLAAAGAAALAYFEPAGPCGVVDASGAPYPVYETLAAVALAAGSELLDVTLRDPLAVEALALRRGARLLVVVANLTPEPRACSVALPSGRPRALELGPYAIARIADP